MKTRGAWLGSEDGASTATKWCFPPEMSDRHMSKESGRVTVLDVAASVDVLRLPSRSDSDWTKTARRWNLAQLA